MVEIIVVRSVTMKVRATSNEIQPFKIGEILEVEKISGNFYEVTEGKYKGLGIFKDYFEPIAEGIKYDNEKLDWSLLPYEQVEEVVKVLHLGAKKYSPDNWKYVQPYRTRYFNATMRHLMAWFMGERYDKETNISHLAHAICCLLFMMWHDGEVEKCE